MKYNITMEEYRQENLIDEEQTTLSKVMEVVSMKQIIQETPKNYESHIVSSTHAGNIGIREIGDEASECVLVLCLSTKNKINAMHKVFAGSLNTSVAHPREIYRTAIMNNAARIILYHNHPSGDTEPSEADLSFTRRLADSGDMLGIELLDHFVVTNDEYLSFREHNYL